MIGVLDIAFTSLALFQIDSIINWARPWPELLEGQFRLRKKLLEMERIKTHCLQCAEPEDRRVGATDVCSH